MTNVRPAEPHDAGALARLRAASMIELGYLSLEEEAAFVRRAGADFARLFDGARLVAHVLCDDDAVVGSACAIFFERLPFPDGALHAEISGVYVDPAYRGAGMRPGSSTTSSRRFAAAAPAGRFSGPRRARRRCTSGSASSTTRAA